ncbi:MAG TPA: VWA domain-containing protein [Blastocatellia bacterium]|nr:VWA domain-containing protein [Blastocatellia bacterium]
MIRHLCIFLIVMSCVGSGTPASGQTNKGGQDSAKDQSVKLQSELVELRAVVTDKQGRLIDGLKKEDFELLENGKPQQVSFFSVENLTIRSTAASKENNLKAGNPAGNAVESTSSAARPPARTIALYVDTLNLSLDSLTRTKQTLHRFVDQRLAPGDMAAVISSTGSGGALEQFTRDRKVLHYAIDRLSLGSLPQESLLTPSLAAAVEAGDNSALVLAEDVVRVEERLHIPKQALEQLTLSKVKEVIGQAAYRRRGSLFTLKAVAESLSKIPGQRIIAMLTDGFSLMDNEGRPDTGDVNSVISRAVRSGVVIYCIDAKGLRTLPGLEAQFPGVGDPHLIADLNRYVLASEEEYRNGVNALAHDTGGELLLNTNDIDASLKQGTGR